MAYEELLVPGTELKEMKFNDFWDWLINVSDLKVHWNYQPSYLLSQAVFLFGGLATLIHALVRGSRFLHLYLAIFIHGFAVESISYVSPDVDNFWHSQTPIIFLGRRLPLHITLLYACFLYNAIIAVSKMRLPKWAEPFAVGLVVVLIDIPYDIVSVRFMHWFWHDTDPNIYDKHYWVPWNSYYFHAAFAASFTFWFDFLKRTFCPSEGKWVKSNRCFLELVTTVITGFVGPIGGILLFIPIYHPLHDNYKIHSEVTFFILFTIFLLIIWSADRKPRNDDNLNKKSHVVHWTTVLLVVHLVLHYAVFLSMTLFFNPEDEVSTGIKEQIGPCDEYVFIRTATGTSLPKRKYLCATDYDEQYFNWSCLKNKNPPRNGSVWYTTCGVPFKNRAEYITIISLISFIAAVVFYNLHFSSFGDAVFSPNIQKSLITKQKKKQK
ncbi:uncharacterized protein LOC132698828 [Cylas formicarius]|uniref:uncharacterized protein LOC132698828 n=1 Tax=Cylas formicarius TaxID=197179 RepID=UPI002958CBAD|nr:uncharacterized protein LOC132698828 [Cylas formicarius]